MFRFFEIQKTSWIFWLLYFKKIYFLFLGVKIQKLQKSEMRGRLLVRGNPLSA